MQEMINIIVQTSGFLSFIFSDFLFACIKSINLHLPTFIVLNIITTKYIIPKYIKVLTHAPVENINLNFVKSASNIFATTILINCDNKNPTTKPTINEAIPIINVSKNNINDIFLLLIPSVRYIPNSLFLLLIKNLLA